MMLYVRLSGCMHRGMHECVGVCMNKSMGPDIITNTAGFACTLFQSGVGNNGIAQWIPSVAQWEGG